MYSLKVRNVRPSDAREGNESKSTEALHSDDSQREKGEMEVEQLCFSAGNPRVEHITGVVHLYRHIEEIRAGEENVVENETSGDIVGHQRTVPLPPARGRSLCVLSLPPKSGFAEFCTFLGTYFERVKEIRLVRRQGGHTNASCLVLLEFDRQQSADDFFLTMNGKEFCPLEPEITCQLVFVKNVEITGSNGISEDSKPLHASAGSRDGAELVVGSTSESHNSSAAVEVQKAPPGMTELPSCPVCLDRLDCSISGIVTTVCNHRFHNECLRQWADTSCPVCRYCEAPRGNVPTCMVCSTHNDLWACLICGHVGCGRYLGSHAHSHWLETGHGYALHLETQRVWDYCSDAYVHRLVRSKTDGKIVEVSSPNAEGTTCGECSGAFSHHGHDALADKEDKSAVSSSKLDIILAEYNHLLVTQLESQRLHFENLAVRAREESEARALAAEERISSTAEMAAEAKKAFEQEERWRRQAEAKLATAKSSLESLRQEKEFLKQLNDNLLANQKDFATREKQLVKKLEEREAECNELREQVRDLMVFIQARDTIENADGQMLEADDLSGGTLLPLPEQTSSKKKQQHRRRGRKSYRERNCNVVLPDRSRRWSRRSRKEARAKGQWRSLEREPLDEGPSMSSLSPGIQTHASFKITVSNRCRLYVSGDVDEEQREALGWLVALYLYHLDRAERFREALLALLDRKPELLEALNGLSDHDIERFRASPQLAMKRVNSMGDLLTLCRAISPATADAIESEMEDAAASMPERRDTSSSSTETDLPKEVLFAAESSMDARDADGTRSNSFTAAVKLVSTPLWERWKQRLRTSIMESSSAFGKQATEIRDEGNAHAGVRYPETQARSVALRISCSARTYDDVPLEVSVLIASNGEELKKVQDLGPTGSPSVKALYMLLFSQMSEPHVMDAIEIECWKHLRLNDPDTFRCTFPTTDGVEVQGKDVSDRIVEFDTGNLGGDEFKSLWMTLTFLECGDASDDVVYHRGSSPWIPDNGRLKLRRRRDKIERGVRKDVFSTRRGSERQVTYEMMVTQGDECKIVRLSQRQAWGVLEAIEAFVTVSPEWCPLSQPDCNPKPLSTADLVLSAVQRVVNLPRRLLGSRA